MDPKEIKVCLKSAREAIRNKDFKDAAKQCKAVLSADPNNYNALVFLGVAAEGLEQIDQALKAYRKAAEQQPDQILAWQGIGSMFDKSPDLMTTEESIEVFQKLASLHGSDETKVLQQLHKLLGLYLKFDNKKALEVIYQLLDKEKEPEKRFKPLQGLVSIMSVSPAKLAQEDLAKYDAALREIIYTSDDLVPDKDSYIRLLLHFVLQMNLKELRKEAEGLRQDFPSQVTPVEYQLRFHLDTNMGKGYPSKSTCDSIEELTSALKALQENNPIINVGLAFTAIQNRNYPAAKELLCAVPEDCVCGQYYLSQVYIYLHCGSKCLEVCVKGLTACRKEDRLVCTSVAHVISLFELAQAEAYLDIGTEQAHTSALAGLEEVQERMPTEAFLIKAYIFLDQGKVQEAQECLSYLPVEALPVQTLKASVLFAKKDFEKALRVIQNVVKEDPSDARSSLLLGLVLWELRDSDTVANVKQECFTTLLKAAKLDSFNHKAFLYIGYFYKEIQKDIVKAKRCFQKAYDLRPTDDCCGSALVNALLALKEEEQSLKVLQQVTSQAPAGCAKWAWLQLGLNQLRQDDSSAAVTSLQSALRADPDDQHVWECLAEAYLQRGSFTAALKAFTKASELNPQSVYCLHQIAGIKQTLGLVAEAIENYRALLQQSASFVPGLKGISESLLMSAKMNISKCLDGLAQSHLEEALTFITRAAQQRPDMSCLWKLLGDTCSLAASLASDKFSVPGRLIGKAKVENDRETAVRVSKLELLQIGSRGYNQALKIFPESDSLWHDLGINLYYQAQTFDSNDKILALLKKASDVMRKAISLEPKEWRHWNALGVFACCQASPKPALAQHCFIKSIECESSNVVAWTNLGALYLEKGDIKLAHDAFKAAQSIDPTYIACWIGQASIAEVVGHAEAMDLFRHTTELGFHVESAVSYGQWVLSVLADKSKRDSDFYQYCIQQMAAVPAASDALARYTTRVKGDATALNMQGMLYEHQNLLSSAVEAYREAVSILEKKDGREGELNTVTMSLARVLCKQKKYEESVRLYEACNVNDNIEHMCMFALAMLHTKRVDLSRKVYGMAMQSCESSHLESQINFVQGMLAYMQGDLDSAKIFLFDGFQTPDPSAHGLFALCSLGLLQDDATLTSAVLDELYKRTDANDYIADTLLLKFCKHSMQGNDQEGLAKLKECLAENPTNSSLWSLLAGLTHRTSDNDGAVVAEYANNALTVGSKGSEIGKARMVQSLGQLAAGFHSQLRSENNALRAAQKAVHTNPGCPHALASLACAVHAEAEIKRALNGATDLLKVEESLLELVISQEKISERLKTWCLQHLVINAILQNKTDSGDKYLNDLKENQAKLPYVEDFIQAIGRLQSASPDPSIHAPKDIEGFKWLNLLINCSILSSKGNFDQVRSLLEAALKSKNFESSHDRCKGVHERLAYVVKAGKDSGGQSDKDRFESLVKALKDKEKGSVIVSLLQAIHTVQETPENIRLIKHCLATALDNVETDRELGFASSVVRQQLIMILWESKKETDKSFVKGLLEDAAAKKDGATSALYKKLINGQS